MQKNRRLLSKYGTVMASLLAILPVRIWVIWRLYRDGFAGLTADEFGRPFLAARWAMQPMFLYDGWWLPHFSYIYGLALRLYWDLVWTPRIVSILFGSAAIVLIAVITWQLAKNAWYGVASALLLAANPLHLWFSAVALSEAPAWFFSFAFLSSYIAYIQRRKVVFLYLASVSLFAANGLRFEPWVISALFILFLTGEGGARWRRSRALDRQFIHLGACAVIAAAFPLFWMASSYVQSGNPLLTVTDVQVYKAIWYGVQADFSAYPRAYWNIDPLLAVLLPAVVIFGLAQFKRRPVLFGYTLAAVCLHAVFVGVHQGRADPPISYQRYLAFYLYMLYPVLVLMLGSFLRIIRPAAGYASATAVLLLLAYAAWQAGSAFQYHNDDSVSGLRAGQAIQYLRETDPSFAQKPVLLELRYWDYLGFHVGANDITQVYYDRVLRRSATNADSLILTDGEALRRCIYQLQFSALVARSPDIKEAIQRELGVTTPLEVNEYTIYPVPEELFQQSQYGSPACPLRPGTGY